MKAKNLFGSRIRQFRMEAGITQEELALRSGLSQGYINQLECGKRNYTQKSLELIAKALSQPVINFLKEDEGGADAKVADKTVMYKTRSAYKKDFLSVLNDLPETVISHYLTILKIERDLLKRHRKAVL
ncbi:MAG: helix-turn-helix domain-containing protein [Nitrospirae bacterium]|nr:MAG: helix-turn-helix domain-containing protein [Nitrospirota bacterium]